MMGVASLKFAAASFNICSDASKEKQIPPLRCASVGMTHSMRRLSIQEI
jgi:hypothetical protein